jgi:hypothetical protein
MNSLRTERYYPYILSVLAVGAWWRIGRPFPADTKEFLGAAVAFAAILTGFLATAQAILMALPSDSVMASIKSSGYIAHLIRYIREAIVGTLLFAVLNLIGFYLDTKKLPVEFEALWILFATFSLLVFWRVVVIVERVMAHR